MTRTRRRSRVQRNRHGELVFPDFPDFRPNLTPREMFVLGSFGGTYWRPIYSRVTKEHLRNVHKRYPATWWSGIPEDKLTRPWEEYDAQLNRYGVKVGTTLAYWEDKGWIHPSAPYGWVMWYCDFFLGRRSPDDARQVDRWRKTAGPQSRFRKWLLRQIREKGGSWDDEDISPRIRQTLQHWGYRLTRADAAG